MRPPNAEYRVDREYTRWFIAKRSVSRLRAIGRSFAIFCYFRCHSLINLFMCVWMGLNVLRENKYFFIIAWLYTIISIGYWCSTVVEQCAHTHTHAHKTTIKMLFISFLWSIFPPTKKMMCIDDSPAYFCCSTDTYPLSYKTTHIKICEVKECSQCVEFQSSIECGWLLLLIFERKNTHS